MKLSLKERAAIIDAMKDAPRDEGWIALLTKLNEIFADRGDRELAPEDLRDIIGWMLADGCSYLAISAALDGLDADVVTEEA